MTGENRSRPGISLVELVVAVALLSLVSVAAIQLLNMTERTMIGSQSKLNDQLRSETQRCDPTREHSICGYYVEFEEPEGENPVKFAHKITLDMERFREFCQSPGDASR